MTRFDAATETERLKLIADAAAAHRARSSDVMTVDVDPDSDVTEGGEVPPWIQLVGTELILDCTDDELERLKDLLGEFPEFRIDELVSPEEAEGTNAVVTARSDANRVAGFVERAFREVYGLDEEYRAWVTAI
ncbi:MULTISPECIES: hypothetical protein [unclassified Halorubrum]|uniref:hypothetical protein n=1 Tax=unclassified Halorubrum TaxID=2642239 RepID=UPI000B9809C2|nr:MULTISPECIES: hypothetical protein [unclassified Halorubrum]OYR44240.1 hypothetical protein DJ81_07590 [Halorubrum sp. Hd13]OYR45513.1 hypothetical protein DJ75_07865 [Halorubrum sp. Eb13]OYR52513.1 hypothetical protein DJ74_00970 [Halorubrum sp. Ea8]